VLFNCGEIMKVAEVAIEGFDRAVEHGFHLFNATSKMVLGSTQVKGGKEVEGMKKILEAQSMVESIGAKVLRTWVLKELLEACLTTGDSTDGLKSYEFHRETHTFTGQRWLDPEIRRLHGELMLVNDPSQTVEVGMKFYLRY